MRNLIFSSVGHSSNLDKHWWGGEVPCRKYDCKYDCKYDLFTCYYDDIDCPNVERVKAVSKYFVYHRGGKFQNLHHCISTHRDVFRGYDNIAVIDDDIIMTPETINGMFELLSRQDAWVVQPSFVEPSKISHKITRCVPGGDFRYVNFIEMNVPFFKGEKLLSFMDNLYDNSMSGYGVDYLYMWYFGQNERRYIISDKHTCVNPQEEPGKIRKIEALQSQRDRIVAFKKVCMKVGCPQSWSHVVIDSVQE
jgi:hypothetical protein